MGNENMTASPSGTFKTGEGLINIAANQQQQFDKLCELIGRKDLAVDGRFVDREDRKKRRGELKAEVESALAAKPAKEWAALLNRYGVPAGDVLSIPEILEHPQIIGRELIEAFPNVPGANREIAVVRSGFHLASGNPRPATPPPALGADTARILKELGYDDAAIAKLKNEKAI
jgi:crotonobetainyl-CoA:carnitine CoA-transferase CaiB-like acyl-CoA transferase